MPARGRGRRAGGRTRGGGRRYLALEARVGRPVRDWTVDDAARGHALAYPDHAPALPAMHQPNVAGTLPTTASDHATFLAAVLAPTGAAGRARRSGCRRRPSARRWRSGWGGGWGGRGRCAAPRRTRRCGRGTGGTTAATRASAPPRGAGAAGGHAAAVFTHGGNGYEAYERLVRAATGVDHDGLMFWMVG